MPAIYAHTVFGEEVLKKLNPELQKIIQDDMDYYNIGVNGPDILFYNQPLKHNPINRLGNNMHKQIAFDFFMHGKNTVKKSINRDAAIAYVCGFICHFILDSECHGYVGECEKKYGASHYEIEADFDRALLVERGFVANEVQLSSTIHYNDEISEVISPFFGIQSDDVKKSLKGMIFFLDVLHCRSSLKRNILFLGMDLVKVSSMKGLVVRNEPNLKCKESTPELIHRLYDSIDLAVQMIEEYMNEIDVDTKINDRFKRNYV